ncbi:MAG: hypothetical protein RL141_1025 [Candidatus Parcubacteria bacterium]|jgi:hypothetical protein
MSHPEEGRAAYSEKARGYPRPTKDPFLLVEGDAKRTMSLCRREIDVWIYEPLKKDCA